MKRLKQVVVGLVWCVVSVGCVAEEMFDSKAHTNPFANQGFVKGEKKNELKKEFPACDEFLNVDWIDAKKGVGYVKHDVYKNDNYLGEMESLVYMHSEDKRGYRPVDRLELHDFRKNNQIDALFDAIKNGTISTSLSPVVKYKSFYSGLLRHNTASEYSYANYYANICIPYPDNKMMWMVERSKAVNVISENELERNLLVLRKIYPTYQLDWIKSIMVRDINNDGIEDYISSTNQSIIISSNESLFSVEKLGFDKNKSSLVYFGIKETQKKCDVYHHYGFFITTDGKNIFLNNQCNVNNLVNYKE